MAVGGDAQGNARLRHSERAISARVLDQTVILDLGADRYTRLNGTASDLWDELAEPRTGSDLVGWLIRAHGIDERRARDDVQAFLAPLLDRGLLEPV
jgi:hypothetical protein